jgi:hypothetical protein
MNGQQLSIFEHQQPIGGSPAAPLQLTPPRARREDPVTSKLAAAQAEELSNAHYALIKQALASVAGATIYELEALTGLDHVQIARRLPEMKDLIATPQTRPGPSGRQCRVWKRA